MYVAHCWLSLLCSDCFQFSILRRTVTVKSYDNAARENKMTDSFVVDRPVICPYDRNHKIAPSRIQTHLVKCSRNYPLDYKVTCPYNATHRLSKTEIQEHMMTCEDHQHVDPIIYETHRTTGAMSTTESGAQSVVDCQESWDDDFDFYPIPRHQDCDNDSISVSSRSTYFESTNSHFIPIVPMRERATNRPPMGLAEAMMLELSEESGLEDTESVVSDVTIGRREIDIHKLEFLRKIGKGRGSPRL